MLITPEIDLTPESAQSLARFEQLFWSGRFFMLANVATLAATDIQTLYRAMDRVVCAASMSRLCTSPEPLTPEERLAAAKAAAAELKLLLEQAMAQVLEWYEAQSPDVQAAFLALLVSLQQWMASIVDSLSPEAQAVVASVKVLVAVLSGDVATRQLQAMAQKRPQV